LAVDEAVVKKATDDKTKILAEPCEQRADIAKVRKVYSKIIEAAADKQKQAQEKNAEDEGGSPAGLIIGILAGVAVIGGLIYCKCNNKLCFEKKEDEEGGQKEDKKIFKKEVKSKNSHKRHAKESLVPSFNVEDQA